MDHSKHIPMRPEEVVASDVKGADVYGPDNSNIGDVAHMHVGSAMASVVIDVGGFLGIGAKRIALPVSQLNFMRDEKGEVHATTRMTKDGLKNLPEHTD